MPGKTTLLLKGKELNWWQHEVKQELREFIWRTSEKLHGRMVHKGMELGMDYHATTRLLRGKQRPLVKKKRQMCHDTGHGTQGRQKVG